MSGAEPPPAVVIDRAAWLRVVEAAEAGARASCAELIAAVRAVEAERAARALSEQDHAVRAAAMDGFGHLVGDAAGFYPVHPGPYVRERADGALETVDPPGRLLWSGGGCDLIVIDRPPIPADQVEALAAKGGLKRYARPELIGTPLRDYMVDLRRARPPWRAMPASDFEGDGAWLVDAEGEPVAWCLNSVDAETAAGALSAVRRLAADVDGAYARRIADAGLVGLVDDLRWTLQPERSAAAPDALIREHADVAERLARLTEAIDRWRSEA